MSVTIVGKVKYARHMQGKTADGKEYSFFSFIVLDTDVTVVVRSFSAGYRTDKETGKKEPQARFFAKDVRVTSAVAGRK